MKQLPALDKAKFQFDIQYIFVFPPTNNRQKTIEFTSEIGTFEIENICISGTAVRFPASVGFIFRYVLCRERSSLHLLAG